MALKLNTPYKSLEIGMSNYEEIMRPIIAGDLNALEVLSELVDDFPGGKDDLIHRDWITNGIDCGSFEVVEWMLSKNPQLVFVDDEGYSVLHSAIERDEPDGIA